MSLRWKLQRSANLKKDYFVFFFDLIPRSAKILIFFIQIAFGKNISNL